MIREYMIKEPSSEAELGKVLRDTALGSRVLELIAKSDPGFIERVFSMHIDAIHLTSASLDSDNHTLPYINGAVSEVIGDVELGIGTGKLEVLGSKHDKEEDRPLRLSVAEADDPQTYNE